LTLSSRCDGDLASLELRGGVEIVLSAKAEDPDVAILGLVDRSG